MKFKHQQPTSSDSCDRASAILRVNKKAHQVAKTIFNNPNLGVPRMKCKDCTSRYQGCHDTCPSYNVAKEYKALIREAKDHERSLARVYLNSPM